jgi:hypothetical protein
MDTIYLDEFEINTNQLKNVLDKFGLKIIKTENNIKNIGISPELTLLKALDYHNENS